MKGPSDLANGCETRFVRSCFPSDSMNLPLRSDVVHLRASVLQLNFPAC